ncbi:MAG TPA: signal peptidase I [Stellaceae bacterium]
MKKKVAGSGVAETIKTLVYAIIIALFVRSFFYEPFNIPSASMVPTLLIGDYLFVSKFSYGYSRYSLPFGLPLFPGRIFFHDPKRGDVTVFKLPADPTIDYIKRIIGLPGDTIQMKQGRLYINDVLVPREPTDFCRDPDDPRAAAYQHYIETLPNGVKHCVQELGDDRMFDTTEAFHVPPGHYFMMGDNRDNSADSRDPVSGVGYVPAINLIGRAQFLFYSTNGYADWWQVWRWPFTVRYDRLGNALH